MILAMFLERFVRFFLVFFLSILFFFLMPMNFSLVGVPVRNGVVGEEVLSLGASVGVPVGNGVAGGGIQYKM